MSTGPGIYGMSKEEDILDLRGLRCPMPLLRAKQARAALTSGQTLLVWIDDEASLQEFECYAEQVGDTVRVERHSDYCAIYLAKF